jgi:putative aldouronate transport system substrate-binding protein
MKRKKKLVSALVMTSMMSTVVMACSSQTPAAPTANTPTAPAATGAATTYPMKSDKTLTYWAEITGNLVGVKSSLGDTPFFQEWQKKTGVPLKFISPPTNQSKEALNVMLASGDLPDMIEFNFYKEFPGGPEKAIKDGYILKLNDLIDKNAPNLKKYLKDHPDIDKMVKTDNGSY